MKKKQFTRMTPSLFTGLLKQPCPVGHFKREDDLYKAYVDWLDYYDPIGFVRNWGIFREYEPEAEDLVLRVQHCGSAPHFAVELELCLKQWYDPRDLKPHFLRRGYRVVAEDGWALWRRFCFDMHDTPEWVERQRKLARFKSPNFKDADRTVARRLLIVEGVEALFQKRSQNRETNAFVDFVADDVAHWTDAQIIAKTRVACGIAEDKEVRVLREDPAFVTASFSTMNNLHFAMQSILEEQGSG